jgi:cobyrinic acid a,c-diamide synthase
MLWLLDALTDIEGTRMPMLGLMPGEAAMQKRFAALGMQRLEGAHGELRGHTFHYSRMSTPLAPSLVARHAQTGAQGEAFYRHGSIVATYMHAYWPSNPAFTAALFHGTAL